MATVHDVLIDLGAPMLLDFHIYATADGDWCAYVLIREIDERKSKASAPVQWSTAQEAAENLLKAAQRAYERFCEGPEWNRPLSHLP